MVTFAFNITFTRADEDHAHTYTIGYNAYGRDIDSVEKAEAQVRLHSDHLTVLAVEHVATLTEDGTVLYSKAPIRLSCCSNALSGLLAEGVR